MPHVETPMLGDYPGFGELFRSKPPPSFEVPPGETLEDLIVKINREQSQRYVDDGPARRRHWAKYTTFFACLKCMDGRVHFPSMTGTPTGLVKPFRAIGGKFEVFWPAFAKRIDNWAKVAMGAGSRSFVFVTYHYSESNPKLGCAGWSYDKDAAKAHAKRLCADLTRVFGEQLTAVVTGVETDTDMLVLHGPNGSLPCSSLADLTTGEIYREVCLKFPAMDREAVKDLVPFLAGNARRVHGLLASPRTVAELDHKERIIALGQGFDWLAQANLALEISDADPNLDHAVATAARIIEKNLQGLHPEDAVMLFTNVPYGEPGIDQRLAIERSKGLMRFAQEHIKEQNPALWRSGRLRFMVGTTFEPSKRLDVIDQGSISGATA